MRFKLTSIFLVLGSVAVLAQQPTATLSGTILDPNGNAVTNIGVSIYAVNTATKAEFFSRIEADGRFRLSIPPGSYDLRVPGSGAMYRQYETKAVTLAAGETKMDIKVAWAGNLGTFADDPFMLMRDIA